MIDSNTNPANGHKKVVVFLHYFGGSENSWKWVIKEIGDHCECIALNLPGFGNSIALHKPSIKNFATFVERELVSLGITNYVLVGHSMGAKIALQMAAKNGNGSIEKLVLIAPSPPGIEPIEKDEKQRMLNHPNTNEATKTVENITKLRLSDAQYKLAVAANLMVDNATWRWWLEEGMNHSIEEETKGLKLSITILNSEADPVITPQIIKERVIPVLTEARLITTKNSGHLIPMENPRWVADQILKLVAQ